MILRTQWEWDSQLQSAFARLQALDIFHDEELNIGADYYDQIEEPDYVQPDKIELDKNIKSLNGDQKKILKLFTERQ